MKQKKKIKTVTANLLPGCQSTSAWSAASDKTIKLTYYILEMPNYYLLVGRHRLQTVSEAGHSTAGAAVLWQ